MSKRLLRALFAIPVCVALVAAVINSGGRENRSSVSSSPTVPLGSWGDANQALTAYPAISARDLVLGGASLSEDTALAQNAAFGDVNLAPYMCFAPGATPEEIAAWYEWLLEQYGPTAYFLGNRWPGTPGNPAIVSWSFVPDGVTLDNGSASTLFATMDAAYAGLGGRATWVAKFQQSFDRVEELSGLIFQRRVDNVAPIPNADADAGGSWFVQSGNSQHGDIRIGMRFIGGSTLAFAFFPGSGQNGNIVFDSQDIGFFSSSVSDFRALRNTFTHELYHAVGVGHVCSVGSSFLMEPVINTSIDGPRHDDLRAVQDHYGDDFENDDTFVSANDLGILTGTDSITFGGTTQIPSPFIPFGSLLSIDSNGDDDWFKFTIDAPRLITIDAVPIGFTYDDQQEVGPNCPACCDNTDSTMAQDLQLEVFAGDGSTLLGTSNDNPIGQTETLLVQLLAAGDYFVRVTESGFASPVQLYELSVAVDATDPCFGNPCLNGTFCDGAEVCTTVGCGAGEQFCCLPPAGEACPAQCCDEVGDTCFDCSACCEPNGVCVDVQTLPECTTLGGFFYGIGNRCVDALDPVCVETDTRITAQFAAPISPPGQIVPVEVFVESVTDLVAYEVRVEASLISGTGTLTLFCPGGATVDESRSDWVFNPFPLADTFSGALCEQGTVSAVSFVGPLDVGATPAYLGEYPVFFLSADATPGSQFQVSIVEGPSISFLLDPASAAIPFIPVSAVITVCDPANCCLAPNVSNAGSKTILIEPTGVSSQALLVTGDPGDSNVACVSVFVQENGELGPNPVFLTPAEWAASSGANADGLVAAHGEEIIPSASYRIQADCNPVLSGTSSVDTEVFGDLDDPPDDFANFADIFLAIQGFQGDFSNVTLERGDINPCIPNRVVNFGDIFTVVLAFQNGAYAAICPIPCS